MSRCQNTGNDRFKTFGVRYSPRSLLFGFDRSDRQNRREGTIVNDRSHWSTTKCYATEKQSLPNTSGVLGPNLQSAFFYHV